MQRLTNEDLQIKMNRFDRTDSYVAAKNEVRTQMKLADGDGDSALHMYLIEKASGNDRRWLQAFYGLEA